MTNEEAITVLSVLKNNEGILENEQNVDALITAISSLESQRWIPVEERLPEVDYQKYIDEDYEYEYPDFLVMIKDAVLPTTLQFDGSHFCDYTQSGWIFYDVTHWMKFPEPPKEKS